MHLLGPLAKWGPLRGRDDARKLAVCEGVGLAQLENAAEKPRPAALASCVGPACPAADVGVSIFR
jgi:hypothetical protein